MPNNLVLSGQIPQHVAQARAAGSSLNLNANASVGISSGFPVLGFAGKEWKIKFRGASEVLPTRELNVVVVGMPPGISKVYYEKGYSQGDSEPPDCSSVDGITPDPSSPKRQSNLCATCPQNRFGSRLSNLTGRPGKACGDKRRIALIMHDDPQCSRWGGPLLLTLPQKSTVTLASYCDELTENSADITQVVSTLSFSSSVTYPLVDFHASGWVDDGVFAWVEHWARSPEVDRMLFDAATLQADDTMAPTYGSAPPPTLLQNPTPPPPPRPAPQQASPFAQAQQPRPGNGAAAPPPAPAPVQAAPPPPPPAPPAPPQAQAAPPPAPQQAQPERRGPGRPPGARNKPQLPAPPQAQAAPTPAPAPAPVQAAPPAPAPAPVSEEETTTPGPVIQGAPRNMATIIDGLLD